MAIAATVAACDSDHDVVPDQVPSQFSQSQFSHETFEPTLLKGSLLTNAPVIGQPSSVLVKSETTWIADAMGDPSIHIIGSSSGELIRSVGRGGKGPGEFASAWNLSARAADRDAIWVFDLSLQRMTYVPQDAQIDSVSATFQLEGPTRVLSAIWANDSVLVGVSPSEESRFVIFADGGQRVRAMNGPVLGGADLPQQERIKASSTGLRLCNAPAPYNWAIVYFTAGRVDYHDIAGNVADSVEVPYPAGPAFLHDEETGGYRIDYSRRWYVDCVATTSHLFALFSGRLEDTYETSEERASGQFIHVFDNRGALVAVLELDRAMSAIGVDEDGTTIVGASVIDSGIYKFVIPAYVELD